MKVKIQLISSVLRVPVIMMFLLFVACSKEETSVEAFPQETFLTFKVATKNSKTLYTKWLPSQFPTTSQNSSEIFSLPLISNAHFNIEKDLILIYGKRNNVFPLPITIPESAESYSVELIDLVNGTLPRLRVTSLLLDPLQNIFFRSNANSQFRVVIVPGEKLLGLNSKIATDLNKMTYKEASEYFGIPQ